LRWILPIVNKEVRLVDVAKICPHGKRSLERWLAAYRKGGQAALEPKSTQPKTHRRETPIRIKEQIIEIRKKTGKCAQKIHWQLEKVGLIIHTRTIGKILRHEGLTRRYRSRKAKPAYVRAYRQLGDLIEIDVKYVPEKIRGKRYFQFTAIDTASRWRHLEIYSEESGYNAVLFLKKVTALFPKRIRAIKTDNGAIFTNRYLGTYKREDLSSRKVSALDKFCDEYGIGHYLIDPGKPAQNGTVERSHREDQEKFYMKNTFKDERDLKKKLRKWNNVYNGLEHCGLNGLSPNEFLAKNL